MNDSPFTGSKKIPKELTLLEGASCPVDSVDGSESRI